MGMESAGAHAARVHMRSCAPCAPAALTGRMPRALEGPPHAPAPRRRCIRTSASTRTPRPRSRCSATPTSSCRARRSCTSCGTCSRSRAVRPRPMRARACRGGFATAHRSLTARWGRSYLGLELTNLQAVLAVALRCGRSGAAVRLLRGSTGAGRMCACVGLTSPGRPAKRQLGPVVGLVPLGTMGRGLPGSLQARGARLRTLPAPPEATLARAATQSAEVA
jgi:hypothetical protein